MKPDPIVAAARFEHEHALVGVGGQPVGQQAAGRAGADNDVIVVALDRLGSGHMSLRKLIAAKLQAKIAAWSGRRRGCADRFAFGEACHA